MVCGIFISVLMLWGVCMCMTVLMAYGMWYLYEY